MRCVALAATCLLGCAQLLGIEDPHGQGSGGPDGGGGGDGATPGWVQVMSLPQGRHLTAVAVLDGKIHLIGGVAGGQQFTGRHDVIDPTLKTAALAAPLSPGRQFHGTNGAVAGGRILVAGDNPMGQCTDDASFYDPGTDAWTPTMAIGAPGPAAPACDLDVVAFQAPNVFAIGGTLGQGTVFDQVLHLDFTQQWNQDQPMPTARASAAAAVFGDRIFVAGGGDAAMSLHAVESYDGNAWRAEAPLVHARSSFGLAVVGTKLFAIGGDNSGALASVEVFDGTTWTPGPDLPVPMSGFATAVVGTTIYVLGGIDGNGQLLDSVLAFTPP